MQNLPEAEVEAEITNADSVNAVSYDARDKAEYFLSTLMAEKAAEEAANLAAAAAPTNVTPTINVTTATDSSHLPNSICQNSMETFCYGMPFGMYSRLKFTKRPNTQALPSSTF